MPKITVVNHHSFGLKSPSVLLEKKTCSRLIDVQIGNTLNAPCKGKARAQHMEGATDQSMK